MLLFLLLLTTFLYVSLFQTTSFAGESDNLTSNNEVEIVGVAIAKHTTTLRFESLNEQVDFYDCVFVATIDRKIGNYPYDGIGEWIPYTMYYVKIDHVIKGVLEEYETIVFAGGVNEKGILYKVDDEPLPTIGETFLFYTSRNKLGNTRSPRYQNGVFTAVPKENAMKLSGYNSNKVYSLQSKEVKDLVDKYQTAYDEGYLPSPKLEDNSQVIVGYGKLLPTNGTKSNNQNFDDAIRLYVGYTVNGNFYSSSDIDYYYFTSSNGGNHVTLECLTPNIRLWISLYQTFNFISPQDETSISSNSSFPMYLDKDQTYYFAISPRDNYSGDFRIRISTYYYCEYDYQSYAYENAAAFFGDEHIYYSDQTGYSEFTSNAADFWNNIGDEFFVNCTGLNVTYDLVVMVNANISLYTGSPGWYIKHPTYSEVIFNSFFFLDNMSYNTSSFKNRVAIHEFGHAIGLDDMYNQTTLESYEDTSNVMTNGTSHINFIGRCDIMTYHYMY